MYFEQIKDEFKKILSSINVRMEEINDVEKLLKLRNEILGRKSFFVRCFKKITHFSKETRKNISIFLNKEKSYILGLFEKKIEQIYNSEIKTKIEKTTKDVTIPVYINRNQLIHPITQVSEDFLNILSSMGFQFTEGKHIEDEYHNFEALNIPSYHPARQTVASFFLKNSRMLRTHTSNVQIRWLKENLPPQKVFTIGQVFRNDNDSTHTPVFHQLEGFLVNETTNMSEMLFTIKEILSAFFKKRIDIRIRPSFFPFTEPSAEIDIRVEKKESWLEVIGCGMIHSKVLNSLNIDTSKYKGYAFGVGLDRLAMIKYNIKDLRQMYQNDITWMRNYGLYPVSFPPFCDEDLKE